MAHAGLLKTTSDGMVHMKLNRVGCSLAGAALVAEVLCGLMVLSELVEELSVAPNLKIGTVGGADGAVPGAVGSLPDAQNTTAGAARDGGGIFVVVGMDWGAHESTTGAEAAGVNPRVVLVSETICGIVAVALTDNDAWPSLLGSDAASDTGCGTMVRVRSHLTAGHIHWHDVPADPVLDRGNEDDSASLCDVLQDNRSISTRLIRIKRDSTFVFLPPCWRK